MDLDEKIWAPPYNELGSDMQKRVLDFVPDGDLLEYVKARFPDIALEKKKEEREEPSGEDLLRTHYMEAAKRVMEILADVPDAPWAEKETKTAHARKIISEVFRSCSLLSSGFIVKLVGDLVNDSARGGLVAKKDFVAEHDRKYACLDRLGRFVMSSPGSDSWDGVEYVNPRMSERVARDVAARGALGRASGSVEIKSEISARR